jgi:hypothetical protein
MQPSWLPMRARSSSPRPSAAATTTQAGSTFLDLDRRTLTRFGPGLHEEDVDVAGGLVLWNQPGPNDAKDVYDVVWNVAHLPLSD